MTFHEPYSILKVCELFLHRIVANHTADTVEKQRHLLDAFSQMKEALTLQEHVVQNVQSLLPQQEEVNKVHTRP